MLENVGSAGEKIHKDVHDSIKAFRSAVDLWTAVSRLPIA